MAQWLVNRGDSQFTVDGLTELKDLAKQGNLDAGDLIQPEGADDWLYAVEIPELKGMVKSDADDDDIEFRRGAGGAIKAVLYGVFSLMLIGGIAGMSYFYTQLPSGEEALIGEGGALKYTEIVTLTPTSLFKDPDAGSQAIASLPKDSVLVLLSKRGDFYKARSGAGQEGWVAVGDILAVYQMGDERIKREMDPLYNPDQYAKVSNAAWVMMVEVGGGPLGGDEENNVADFRFMLENTSDYDMADLVLQATIKDSKGTEVDSIEFEIGGVIPADSSTMVGTLPPPEDVVKAAEKAGEEPPEGELMTYYSFEKMVKALPEEEQEEYYLRWLDSIKIDVKEEFVEATIRIVELRAIPVE